MDRPFPLVLENAGIRAKVLKALSYRGNVWLVEVDGTAAVLRRVTHLDVESVRWEEEFLTALIAQGFPAPTPITVFRGHSWTEADGAIWKLNGYLPGEALGWRGHPSLRDVGRFIGHYHDVVATIAMKWRPGFLPLRDTILNADPVMVERCLGADAARGFWIETRRVSGQLEDAGYLDELPIITHGDFHCENIVVAGEPPTFAGVIDFGSAHHDPALVDLAFSIWRSGRSDPDEIAYDVERVAGLAAGYLAARTVPRNQARLLPTYLVARGLVLITNWSRRGLGAECQVAWQRVRWLLAHLDQVSGALRDPGGHQG